MRKLFTIGGIALALLLSACATNDGTDGAPQLQRQDIVKEMQK